MPITRSTFKSWARSRLEREIAYCNSLWAIAGTGTITEDSTLAQVVAGELSATGYQRINVKPATTPAIEWSESLRQWQTPQASYAATIPGTTVLLPRWVTVLANATGWASVPIASIASSTLSFAAPAGFTLATGDRVLVSADSGSLPAEISASQVYTLQSVATASGTTTAKLRAVGAGTDLAISGSPTGLRLRNASGEIRSFWDLGEPYPAVTEWRVLTNLVESLL